MMKWMNLIGVLFLSLYCGTGFAQEVSERAPVKTVVVNGDKDTVFNKTIDYLQENGYFIQVLDGQAGFVQAKLFIKNKKVLSSKTGERRTLNFIIRPATEGRSKITLTIYSEERTFGSGGEGSLFVYYYKEGEILEDESVYQAILDDLLVGLQ